MGDQVALSGGLRLVDVRQILDVFLEQTSSQLADLSAQLGAQGDADRQVLTSDGMGNTYKSFRSACQTLQRMKVEKISTGSVARNSRDLLWADSNILEAVNVRIS